MGFVAHNCPWRTVSIRSLRCYVYLTPVLCFCPLITKYVSYLFSSIAFFSISYILRDGSSPDVLPPSGRFGPRDASTFPFFFCASPRGTIRTPFVWTMPVAIQPFRALFFALICAEVLFVKAHSFCTVFVFECVVFEILVSNDLYSHCARV